MRTVSAFSVQFKVAKIYNELTREKVTLYERKAWIVGAARGMYNRVYVFVVSVISYRFIYEYTYTVI